METGSGRGREEGESEPLACWGLGGEPAQGGKIPSPSHAQFPTQKPGLLATCSERAPYPAGADPAGSWQKLWGSGKGRGATGYSLPAESPPPTWGKSMDKDHSASWNWQGWQYIGKPYSLIPASPALSPQTSPPPPKGNPRRETIGTLPQPREPTEYAVRYAAVPAVSWPWAVHGDSEPWEQYYLGLTSPASVMWFIPPQLSLKETPLKVCIPNAGYTYSQGSKAQKLGNSKLKVLH